MAQYFTSIKNAARSVILANGTGGIKGQDETSSRHGEIKAQDDTSVHRSIPARGFIKAQDDTYIGNLSTRAIKEQAARRYQGAKIRRQWNRHYWWIEEMKQQSSRRDLSHLGICIRKEKMPRTTWGPAVGWQNGIVKCKRFPSDKYSPLHSNTTGAWLTFLPSAQDVHLLAPPLEVRALHLTAWNAGETSASALCPPIWRFTLIHSLLFNMQWNVHRWINGCGGHIQLVCLIKWEQAEGLASLRSGLGI